MGLAFGLRPTSQQELTQVLLSVGKDVTCFSNAHEGWCAGQVVVALDPKQRSATDNTVVVARLSLTTLLVQHRGAQSRNVSVVARGQRRGRELERGDERVLWSAGALGTQSRRTLGLAIGSKHPGRWPADATR